MSLPSSAARRKSRFPWQTQPGYITIFSLEGGLDDTKLKINFAQKVVLNGTPQMKNDLGVHVVSAVQTSATQIEMTFNADYTGGSTLIITPFDPAIRGANGQLLVGTLVNNL